MVAVILMFATKACDCFDKLETITNYPHKASCILFCSLFTGYPRVTGPGHRACGR